MFLRVVLFLACLILAVPVLTLIVLAFTIPVTLSGAFYLLGSALFIAGLILAIWRNKIRFVLGLSGILMIVSVAGVRLNEIRSQDSKLKVLVLPTAKETRFINALIDERDLLLFGEGLLHLAGGVSAREHANLFPVVSLAYQEAKAAYGDFSSPIVSTYLGLQKPDAFDAVVIEPALPQSATIGIIFLHGFAGNVSVQCWVISQAVETMGALTVCPSTNWVGEWWQPEGEAILRETFAYLRERGIQRIYLGGFSNGGNGVGRLISTVAHEPELKGLFFVAGVNNAAGVRETELPVLVIQGINDERMPVAAARQFVGELGLRVTYVELEADHFLIMKQPSLVQEAISTWLQERESTK